MGSVSNVSNMRESANSSGDSGLASLEQAVGVKAIPLSWTCVLRTQHPSLLGGQGMSHLDGMLRECICL